MKHILITGANRGIGREIGRQLALMGHTVVMTSRDQEKGAGLVEKIEGNVLTFPLDVTDVDAIARLADFVAFEFGKLDVLINNAGIGIGDHGLEDANVEEIKKIMEVNFYGPIRIIKALLPALFKSEDARVINVSSGMGTFQSLAEGGYAGYRLSKAGLNAQTVLLAHELSGTNVKVNAMCPGWVRTDMGGSHAERSVEEGADTAVWLATSPGIPSGKLFRDRKEIPW